MPTVIGLPYLDLRPIFVGGMDMQQRAVPKGNCVTTVELSNWGNQRLWDLAKANPSNKELLIKIRAILLERTRDNARQAVAWIEGRVHDLENPPNTPEPGSKKSKWGIAAAITAGFLAISGGIAHGAGVSIWHGLIKPLFIGG